MIASEPVCAAGGPPDTGASTQPTPSLASAVARWTESPGSELPISTTTASGRKCSVARASSAPVAAESDTMITTTSACAAVSRSWASSMPVTCSGVSCVRFQPRTSNPAALSVRAIGRPISPRPSTLTDGSRLPIDRVEVTAAIYTRRCTA